MSERVASYDISNQELQDASTGAGGTGTIEKEIPIPPAAKRWTLLVKPEHVVGPPTPNITGVLQYAMRGVFCTTNPPSAAVPFNTNEIGIVTREDVVSRVKIIFTLAADPADQPDQGIKIDLNIAR